MLLCIDLKVVQEFINELLEGSCWNSNRNKVAVVNMLIVQHGEYTTAIASAGGASIADHTINSTPPSLPPTQSSATATSEGSGPYFWDIRCDPEYYKKITNLSDLTSGKLLYSYSVLYPMFYMNIMCLEYLMM